MLLGLGAAYYARLQVEPVPTIGVWEETLWTAEDAGFDYERKLALAEQGNDDALVELILFCHKTDAAGSLGHAIVLYQLLEKLGDARFAQAIRAARNVDPRPLGDLLAAGVDYSSGVGAWRGVDEIDAFLKRGHPHSRAAQNAEVESR